jgi:hypothetical protein
MGFKFSKMSSMRNDNIVSVYEWLHGSGFSENKKKFLTVGIDGLANGFLISKEQILSEKITNWRLLITRAEDFDRWETQKCTIDEYDRLFPKSKIRSGGRAGGKVFHTFNSADNYVPHIEFGVGGRIIKSHIDSHGDQIVTEFKMTEAYMALLENISARKVWTIVDHAANSIPMHGLRENFTNNKKPNQMCIEHQTLGQWLFNSGFSAEFINEALCLIKELVADTPRSFTILNNPISGLSLLQKTILKKCSPDVKKKEWELKPFNMGKFISPFRPPAVRVRFGAPVKELFMFNSDIVGPYCIAGVCDRIPSIQHWDAEGNHESGNPDLKLFFAVEKKEPALKIGWVNVYGSHCIEVTTRRPYNTKEEAEVAAGGNKRPKDEQLQQIPIANYVNE